MAALLAVGLALLRGRIRSLLPARFRRGDVLAACAAAALYATAPANFLEGAPAVANLFYGSILTPAAEEALFRGWLWGELQAALLAVGLALLRGRIRSLLPARFRKGDVLAACAAAALYATAPANYLEGAPAVANLLCGSILTPAAEEVLFRGWLWGELQAALPSGRSVLAWNAALFALWHIGYVVPNLAAGDLAAVAGKVAAGLAYGVLLAAIRRRTGNVWGAFLAHGVCNLFRI